MNRHDSRGNGWAIDLVLVAAVTAITAAILLGPEIAWPIEWSVGILLLLFLPGYAIVSALFPRQPATASGESEVRPWDGNPGWTVRIALSLVLSAIVVAVVGVLLDWVMSIRLAPAVGAITLVTLGGVAIAAIRRVGLSRERPASPFSGSSLTASIPTGTTLQTVSLVIALLVLVSTVAFVGAVPPQGESYSESYLLTQGEDGEFVAEDHPTTFVAGEGHPLHLGIENHEHRPVSYEVVVVAQEVESDGSVTSQQEVDRFETELAHGESAVVERDIAPTMTGEELRLQFQVYKDGQSGDDDSPDQTLQLWIDVVEETGG